MILTRDEDALLRVLVVRGRQTWKDMDGLRRQAFDGLQVLGYARRTGHNGTGQWAGVTPRGVLKALALKLIPHHPEDPEPAAAMLLKDRVRDEISR